MASKAQPQVTAKLIGIVGTGFNTVPGGASFPQAKYCNSGQILTCFGRGAYTLETDLETQKLWTTTVPTMSLNEAEGPAAASSSSAAAGVWGSSLVEASGTIQDISAVAVSECGKYVVIGGRPLDPLAGGTLSIFSAASGTLLVQLAGDITGGVVAVGFSRDGLLCACIGEGGHFYFSRETT